jgi:hypothetical protein
MNIRRELAPPVTAGAFLLLAVSGMLMFFHADSGLKKVAREWLSRVLLGGAALHVTAEYFSGVAARCASFTSSALGASSGYHRSY